MKKLILIGAGGHCKSVIDAAESAGFEIIGILDVVEKVGEIILGYPVIGTDEMIPEFVDSVLFVISVGFISNPDVRIRLHQKVIEEGGRFATIIASSAYVSKHSNIGDGTVVLQHACVNAEANIGFGCIINTFANIDHEASIDNYSHISTGVMVNGACKIGKGVFIGSQSVLSQAVSIADYSIISAGSFVRKNIVSSGIYAGNPIRKIK
ncbi:acetyltransferase [Dysgonomonas macrotermitis]|uniref:Sugar O-acyltransferase, sialic acid O-acetyltransferase NeuD family n=1 Tax=Dysgonomonas macrotermitis TaxID=1346286 RepID=A0A1M5I3B7_9BACT|nr:acetyltransferase [Dysgonomonas macrotermitis]SHG22776.1 sugar O-acyltransferase, sialic acid O-acetyltransferase NeuD family [Dysgonomonas macrotermitis]